MENVEKYIKIVAAFLIVCIISTNVFASNYIYEPAKDESSSYIVDESSISTNASTPDFQFQSAAQVLMEPKSGKIIYANNENERLLPASVTKVMTLLLIMEQIDSGKMSYQDTVTCSANASKMGGSQIWFKEGETLTIDEALKCICVVSANDVTVAMAEKIGGTESNFVSLMNKKAEELGMTNTHFMNSHGIDEDGHYTTAHDIALMSRELITKHPDILKYTSIWMDSIRGGTFNLSSTNKLIRFYDGATGLKTGSTSKALFNLSGSATRDNTSFIAVVMKAPSSDIRLAEVKQLLDYGFATYETQNILEKRSTIEEKSINKNVKQTAKILLESDVVALLEKGCKIDYTQNIEYNKELVAPLKSGEVVGKIDIINTADNSVVGTSNLIIGEDVEKSSFKDYIEKIFNIFILNT